MAIFMIGTQRSGSNLLRLMLNQIPEIAAPHPPHILKRMMPLVGKYGDLTEQDNFEQLVDDVCQLVLLNPVPWKGVELDPKIIIGKCRTQTLLGVFEAIYDAMAQAAGASQWCCKSLANVHFLERIEAYFKRPKYIYLYRDGRDVAVSFRKAVVGEKHFYHIAHNWAHSQKLALEHGKKIGSGRFIHLSYEALITDPESTMRRLCRCLDVVYTPSMMDFYQSDEAKRAASSGELWGNVNKPVQANNCGNYLREANKDDIRIFESIAGDVLDELGYDRHVVEAGMELTFNKRVVRRYNKENQRLKTAIRRKTDPDDLQRRDRQQNFMQDVNLRLQESNG